MRDSLILQKLTDFKVMHDSTIGQLKHVNDVVSNLENENIFLKILPLIGVIIGGFITWFIQKSLKDKEVKLAIGRELRDTINRILTSLTSLQFHLKELAYLEVDSKYQYQIYCNSEGDIQKRALEEHYNDYKYISDVKSKISTCVAEINSDFPAYYKLLIKPLPENTSTKLLTFTSHILTLQREKEFEEKDVTTEIIESKINVLTVEYTKNISTMLEIARLL